MNRTTSVLASVFARWSNRASKTFGAAAPRRDRRLDGPARPVAERAPLRLELPEDGVPLGKAEEEEQDHVEDEEETDGADVEPAPPAEILDGQLPRHEQRLQRAPQLPVGARDLVDLLAEERCQPLVLGARPALAAGVAERPGELLAAGGAPLRRGISLDGGAVDGNGLSHADDAGGA